jgi:hypothetical protein
MKDSEAREMIEDLEKRIEKLEDQLNYPLTYGGTFIHRVCKAVDFVEVLKFGKMTERFSALLDHLGLEIVAEEMVVRKKKE